MINYRVWLLLFFSCMMELSVYGNDVPELWSPYGISKRQGKQSFTLEGKWKLSYSDVPVDRVADLDSLETFETEVPNSVHWSLYKAGKLPHPYEHKNSTQYRWIEEKVWYYRKTIHVPKGVEGNYVFLCFDGIDYFAKVWLNGELLGKHEGMFGGPNVEVSSMIRYGQENEVVVEVLPGNWRNRATNFESLPRTPTGELDYSGSKGYNPRASGRIIKPWSIAGGSGTEAFFCLGMWQGARLEIVPKSHLERPFIQTIEATADSAVLGFSCEVLINTHSLEQRLHHWGNTSVNHPNARNWKFPPAVEGLQVKVTLASAGEDIRSWEFAPQFKEGRNWLDEKLVLKNPQLWFPNGLGEPFLYQVRVTLLADGQVRDELMFDYGIRTFEMLPASGPRLGDRWDNWQCVVNGQKLFVKGMNWVPADALLDLTPERYRWALEAMKAMGVQMVRVWGGGLLETDIFYNICNELGIMVWQDFPIGNQDTPKYPQDVWEAQVVQNITRLRNHPALVVWCGGNEFNPYSLGNAATIGILERNLQIFDDSRFFARTSPDGGNTHAYPDVDASWFDRIFKHVPWMGEIGMHSMPEVNLFYETVDKSELHSLGNMWQADFYKDHPEFIHHFTEYGPARVPRMLNRASHIIDMTNPSIKDITEATQIGAGEWYQIMSEKVQGNYPVTTGLIPWVFKRHWPVIAIQMMDWYGQPVAPYYFLKRTYDKNRIMLDLPRILWKPDETIPLKVKILNLGLPHDYTATVSVKVYDQTFTETVREEKKIRVTANSNVIWGTFDGFQIPSEAKNKYFFLVAESRNDKNELISQAIYWPRTIPQMENDEFYNEYISKPVPFPNLEKGPWLKHTVAKNRTQLKVENISLDTFDGKTGKITYTVNNTGKYPAFMNSFEIEKLKRRFYATDNFFWLNPQESKEVQVTFQLREKAPDDQITISFSAWNADTIYRKVKLNTRN